MAIRTAIPWDKHRSTPLASVGGFADTLESSGVVDQAWFWDELSAFVPSSLWRPDVIPAAQYRDAHSTHDPLIAAAFSLAANPRVSVRVTTDAIRSRPAELMRSMMSLASATEGDAEAICSIGAGELRQSGPFGYRRSEGLARMEDIFRITRLLWDNDDPINFDGNHWKFREAHLGTVKERRPKFWALGGGPALIDLATRYADGFETAVPMSVVTADQWAGVAKDVKQKVAENGCDPDAFGLGVWFTCAVHDDPDVLQQVFDNPFVKVYSALFGRFTQPDWRREGLEPIMADKWHYALKWTPTSQSPEELQKIADQVPPEMVRRAFFNGSVAEVSATAREFVDAGATFVGVTDLTPIVLPVEDAPQAFERDVALCAALKRS